MWVFWVISLPFRAVIHLLRFIAKPGAEITGFLAAGLWWLSATGSKNLLMMAPDHPASMWLANFSADANVQAAALTGISVFLMSFIEHECKEDYGLRDRVNEMEIALRRLSAERYTMPDKMVSDRRSEI